MQPRHAARVALLLVACPLSSGLMLSAMSRAAATLPSARCVSATMGFLDDIVTGIADKISEQEKGLGILKYSGDFRKARASHILFSYENYPEDGDGPNGETMAKALKQKILDGEYTFEFVAEKFSACSSSEKGGDLGEFKRNDMVPEFDQAVFEVDDAVPIGTLQGPIKTVFGYHLIKVTERDEISAGGR